MAENEFNEKSSNIDLTFTAASAIYQANPDAAPCDITDHMNAKLGQLSAMLHLIFGEGLGRFNNMGDAIQDNYLWSCAMITDECKELAERR
jgi:hypothetical protein